MPRKIELRLAGSGGQGLVLAGIILAEAAVLFDGKNAVQTQSYGPEARGGASKSEVIISEGDIDYPKCENLDALLALTQESCNKYIGDLKPGGLVLLDEDLVHGLPDGPWEKVIRIPFTAIAREDLGKQMVANIVALGALVELTGVVTSEAIEQAVLKRVPKGTEDLNKRALNAGMEAARKAA